MVYENDVLEIPEELKKMSVSDLKKEEELLLEKIRNQQSKNSKGKPKTNGKLKF